MKTTLPAERTHFEPVYCDPVYKDTPRYDPSCYEPLYNDTPCYDPSCHEPLYNDTPCYDPTRYETLYKDAPRYDPSRYDPVYNDTPRYDPLRYDPKFLERAHFAPQYSAYPAETLPRRRGVLLILVLGLLAMFGMIGLSFLMMSSHQRQGAEVIARIDQQEFAPEQVADEAILQVLRGTENPLSVLRNHSLLEDMYGKEREKDESYTIRVTNWLNVRPSGELEQNLIFEAAVLNRDGSYSGLPLQELREWIGKEIFFTSGDLEGTRAQVVGCRISDPSLDSNDMLSFSAVLPPINPFNKIQLRIPLGDKKVLIDLLEEEGFSRANVVDTEGKFSFDCAFYAETPFHGTGFGFNTTTVPVGDNSPLLTATDPIISQVNPGEPNCGQRALLPNPVYFQETTDYDDPSGPGDANEDYDAADYQNMLLALQIPQGQYLIPQGQTPIPSLHRPSLISWWLEERPDLVFSNSTDASNWGSASGAERCKELNEIAKSGTTGPIGLTPQGIFDLKRILRRVILRPLPQDHKNFTGSNPNWYPLNYGHNPFFDFDSDGDDDFLGWDVDNDGDGVNDSVWVDLGLPVQITKDGRMVKPLAAILCVDLDGRLNLNAHGSMAQAVQTIDTQCDRTLGWGQGWGAADVSLSPVFSDKDGNIDYDLYSNILKERYGGLGYWLQSKYPSVFPEVKRNWFNRNFDLPMSFDTSDWDNNSSYGAYPDLFGSLKIELDNRGQPVYTYNHEIFSGFALLLENNPYLSLLGEGTPRGTNRLKQYESDPDVAYQASNSLYGYGDLESMLRAYDNDANILPDRLLNLPRSLGQDSPLLKNRLEVTTESWSVPKSFELSEDIQTALASLKPTYELAPDKFKDPRILLEELLASNGIPANQIFEISNKLLPPEFLFGGKLNLNMPFGNGRDDDSDGVIDDPGETDEELKLVDADGNWYDSSEYLDFDNDGETNPDDAATGEDESIYAYSRQLYARHLYVLALLVMDFEPDPSSDADKAQARMVAQWAINVVDYRDRDAIMTPFEYDVNPFDDNTLPQDGDPWDVDGDISSASPDNGEAYRGLVWGCERPELLITETLATHDIRVTKELGPPVKYKQYFKPVGSLFVELHNPWNAEEALPGEFYEKGGVDLSKKTADDDPVWRLKFKEVEHPDDSTEDREERTVYFVKKSSADIIPNEGEDARYYLSDPMDTNMAPILPGRYAVIGSGDPDSSDDKSITFLNADVSNGTYDEVFPLATTRRIILDPKSGSEDPKQVQIWRDGATDDLVGKTIQPPIAITVNQPVRMSLTEPAPNATVPEGGYTDLNYDSGTKMYATAIEQPLDLKGEPVGRKMTRPFDAQLQRLANPLIPYDRDTNPYLTIDEAPVEISVFNSLVTTPDEDIKSPLERGEPKDVGDPAPPFWNSAWKELDSGEKMDIQFQTKMNSGPKVMGTHTLGYLSSHYGAPQAASAGPPIIEDGDPLDPFPWMTWANRPLISAMELLQIPRVGSFQLLKIYSTGTSSENPYAKFSDANDPDDPREHFSHLMNFFYEDVSAEHGKLHRLFDYVEVPCRFADAGMALDPADFSGGGDIHRFHPPYNWIPNTGRQPGRVNLNTIVSKNVWKGISGTGAPVDDLWTDFVESRRGYKPNTAEISQNYWYRINPTSEADAPKFPTRFANPFRSFAGHYLVPDITDASGNNLQTDSIGSEVGATVFRSKETVLPPLDPDASKPLFMIDSAAGFLTDQNPYFRYLELTRLGNLATTQSNVYAVWVTIGYFEVEKMPAWEQDGSKTDAVTGDPIDVNGLTREEHARVYPGGYTLGAELGGETGDFKRNRSFYIIDRSIPVGFQRGKDLNVKETIRLKRRIE